MARRLHVSRIRLVGFIFDCPSSGGNFPSLAALCHRSTSALAAIRSSHAANGTPRIEVPKVPESLVEDFRSYVLRFFAVFHAPATMHKRG